VKAGAIALAALAAGAAPPVAAQAPSPAPVAPADARWDAPGARNPLLPGYFADPSIVRHDGRWYIYATIDPWGDDRLGLWQSTNGRDWTFSTPDWPTKAAATGPTSNGSKVWAPSVVRGRDGRWWMYVSVGSEVWVGTAPSPAGPWRDANGGKPLIAKSFDLRYHMIDAEAFVDDDGQAYLYWGSGLNWVNGHCFVVKLKPDMVTFDGTPRDVTPGHYFEGPFMFKANGRYFLTYSDGNTTKDTYQVRYATGSSPLGPFTEAAGNPILATDAARDIISPGHHAIFRSEGQPYILYHRQGLPWPTGGDAVLRQVAVDPLTVRGDGTLARVAPSHGSDVKGFAARRASGLPWTASGAGLDALHGAARAADDNYATLWKPPVEGPQAIIADLGRKRAVRESRLRPEYATRAYRFGIDASDDGRTWRTVAAVAEHRGSPIVVPHAGTARYLRVTFAGTDAGLWEWGVD